MPAVSAVVITSIAILLHVSTETQIASTYFSTMETARRYASDFDAEMRANLSTARTLSETMRWHDGLNRRAALGILHQVLVDNPEAVGSYVGYEPNAFDGHDASNRNAPGSDPTGRFIPYWNRLTGMDQLNPLTDVDTSDWYNIPKRTMSRIVAEPLTYHGVLMTSFIYPILKNGKFVGIAGVDVRLAEIHNKISRVRVFKTGYAFLVSNKGTFVSFPKDSYSGRKTLSEVAKENSNVPLARIARNMEAGKEGYGSVKDPITGRDTVLFYSPVRTGKWSMAIVVPRDEMLAGVNRLARINVLIGVLALLIAGLLIALLADSLAKPITSLRYVADRITEGDLDAKAATGNDEVGSLGTAFNVMTERLKETLDSLHASEKKFRSLIEYSSDLITVIGADGKIKYESPSVQRLLGYDPGERMGVSAYEALDPEYIDRVRSTIEFLLRNGGIAPPIKIRIKSKNGGWRSFEAIGINKLDDPAVGGIIVNARDITEREKAEEELRIKNAILRTQLETSIDGIFVVGSDGGIVLYNQRFLEIWQIPEEAMKASTDEVALQYARRRLVNPEEFLNRVMYLYAHPNETSWEEVELLGGIVLERYSAPMFGSDGSYYGRAWFFRDVSERKRIERELAESEKKFSKTFHSNPADMTLATADEGRFLDVNEEFENVMGYSRAEVIGRTAGELNIWVDISDRKGIVDSLRRGEKVRNTEAAVRAKSGEIRKVLVSADIIEIDGVEYLLIATSDITERLRISEELKASEDKFSKAFRQSPVIMSLSTMEEGRYVDVNDAFLRQTGFSRDEVIGHTSTELNVWLYPQVRDAVIESLKRGQSVRNLEVPIRIKSGEIRITLFSVDAVEIAGETLVFVAVYDITDLRRADERRRQLEASAEAQKRQFYREAILSVSEGKLEMSDPYTLGRYTAQAQMQLEVPAFRQISSAREDVRQFCTNHDLAPEQTDVFIQGVGEAITNAVKHAGSGTVFCGTTEGSIWVAVSDRGKGIESLILPRSGEKGFSTQRSMGLGYTMILDSSDHVLLDTGQSGTTVILIKNFMEHEIEVGLGELPDTWA